MMKNKPSPTDSFLFQRPGISTNNRIVLAAMTNKQSHDNGTISQAEINWLARRANGGFGVITTAATHVAKHGQGWEGEFGVFDDSHRSNLSLLAKSIHSYDSLIIAQLFHGGAKSPQGLTGMQPISASVISSNESYNGYTYAASERDIANIIKDFTSAAIRCAESGLDGIELHGAHGYLLSQFLGKETNMRTDKWGGSFKNNSRILFEIYKSIKNNVHDSFIVGVRLSPEIKSMGIDIEDSIAIASKLADMGVDYIHLSCWDVFSKSQTYPEEQKTLTESFIEGCNKRSAIISTGNIWSAYDAQKLLNQGADLIGVARVGIPYPDWADNVVNKNYSPPRPPFKVSMLKSADLSNPFIEYMRKWKGFVEDD